MTKLWKFVFFWDFVFRRLRLKITKWPYILCLTSNPKNKGTLFSPTFEIDGNEVPLLFDFKVKWPSYRHFVFSGFIFHWAPMFCIDKRAITWPNDLKIKNKHTLFSPTFKIEENKVSLLFLFQSNITALESFCLFPFWLLPQKNAEIKA